MVCQLFQTLKEEFTLRLVRITELFLFHYQVSQFQYLDRNIIRKAYLNILKVE